MPVELVKEKYSGAINTVEIGLPGISVKIGGETGLPFLFEEGAMPNPPVVALEIADKESPGDLKGSGVKVLCVRLESAHPDCGGCDAGEIIARLKSIAKLAAMPLVIIGCGDVDRDNEVLPKVSQEFKGENCLFGIATQANYKTLAAMALADGHSLIAESPIDINIAKQLNILVTDMGFDPSRIVMHPTTTSLGYGMEYVYSIMERARLAAFIGDKMLSMPLIAFVGQEVWKTKEAKENQAQGINWEVATAASMLQAGGDLIVMKNLTAAKAVAKYIDSLMKK